LLDSIDNSDLHGAVFEVSLPDRDDH
jgi:hypothetical protein